MRIVISLIVMAMISMVAYAADPATSTAPTKSASAAQPPKGLKGDTSTISGKVTIPADETTKAPASGSVPSSRLPK